MTCNMYGQIFDLMTQDMAKKTNTQDDSWVASSWPYIRDNRSLHMGYGKQTGKTAWIVDKMREENESIVVYLDKAGRDEFRNHADIDPRRSYAITDLLTQINCRNADVLGQLSRLRIIFFDDASRNFMIGREAFTDAMYGTLPKDVTVVMMG